MQPSVSDSSVYLSSAPTKPIASGSVATGIDSMPSKVDINPCDLLENSKSSAPLFVECNQESLHSIPGSLHLVPDASIERLIEKHGAVNLLRQLAKDVAERDSFISDLKFHFESREYVFRELLREHGLDPVLANTKLSQRHSASFFPSSQEPSIPENPSSLTGEKPHLYARIDSAINEPFTPSDRLSPSSLVPLLKLPALDHAVSSSSSSDLPSDPNSASYIASSKQKASSLKLTSSLKKFYSWTSSSSLQHTRENLHDSTSSLRDHDPSLLSSSKFFRSSPRCSTPSVSSTFVSATSEPEVETYSVSTKNSSSNKNLRSSLSKLLSTSNLNNKPLSLSSTAPSMPSIGFVELGNMIPKETQPPSMRNDWKDYLDNNSKEILDQFGFLQKRPSHDTPLCPEDIKLNQKQTLSFYESNYGLVDDFFGNELDGLNDSPLLLNKKDILLDMKESTRQKNWSLFFQRLYKKYKITDEDTIGLLGISSIGVKGRHGKKRWHKFRELVKNGVPLCYKAKVWLECSGAYQLHSPGYYEELLSRTDEVESASVAQIDMDINRTMAKNVFFGGKGPGIPKLRRILVAYSRHNPHIGYCQGMNVIGAFLLLLYASEEDAFYMLMSIIENVLPPKYFTPDLMTSRADQLVLKSFVKESLPEIYSHLELLGVDLDAISFHWFLSVYTDTLPTNISFRIFDMLFCDGYVCLFRVALTILKSLKQQILACNSSSAIYSLLSDLVQYSFQPDSFIKEAADRWSKLVTEKSIERKRNLAISSLNLAVNY
ncbi:TBC domain-containing protein C4G8.04 [Schizosaccharomyces pombe]